jgi:hypothetical protein
MADKKPKPEHNLHHTNHNESPSQKKETSAEVQKTQRDIEYA